MSKTKERQDAERKFLYAKGGAVVQESRRLLADRQIESLPQGGPDLFLLAMSQQVGHTGTLMLTSVGSETQTSIHRLGWAKEYGARPLLGSTLVRRFAYGGALLRMLKDTLAFKPDYIFAGVEGPFALVYFLAATLLRCPFVMLVHVAPDQASLSKITRLCNRFVARKADAVIVHGPYLRECALGMGVRSEKLIEFDTGTDLPKFEEDCLRDSTLSFVFAGRIEAEKGVFDLLEAFNTFRKNHFGKLIYFGDGAAVDELKQRANSSPNAKDIEVLGKAPQNVVFSAVASATASVTPTRSVFPEGRCMTALESLALGTPVIAPNFGPFPYAVNHGVNGLLYEPDQVNSLASCMMQLANDADIAQRLKLGAIDVQSRPTQFTSFTEALASATKACEQ